MRTKSQNELTIAVYARGIRNIQKTQLEPYETLIQEELGRLFPSLLKNNEDGVIDWSYDIMNCSSDDEVFETLERIRQIQREKQKVENERESEPLNTVEQLKSQMSRMQDYITQLESRLSYLETQYEEPTN